MRYDPYDVEVQDEEDEEADTDPYSRPPTGRVYEDYYFLVWDRRDHPGARPSWY
jgi:hypothetical protein